VDEGRRADPEDARAREDKDHGDRAETWAERGSDISEGKRARCDSGRRSREEEEGVKAEARLEPARPADHSADNCCGRESSLSNSSLRASLPARFAAAIVEKWTDAWHMQLCLPAR
jgi:hypothetical protein